MCLYIDSHRSENAARTTGKLGDESSLKARRQVLAISGGLDSTALFQIIKAHGYWYTSDSGYGLLIYKELKS